jgi:hypothetical protein
MKVKVMAGKRTLRTYKTFVSAARVAQRFNRAAGLTGEFKVYGVNERDLKGVMRDFWIVGRDVDGKALFVTKGFGKDGKLVLTAFDSCKRLGAF